jgi:hypothetical protein
MINQIDAIASSAVTRIRLSDAALGVCAATGRFVAAGTGMPIFGHAYTPAFLKDSVPVVRAWSPPV